MKQTKNDMNTLENITKEIETAKLKLKYAKASTTVINAFKNKEYFEFTCSYTDRKIKLFPNDKVIYFGEFQFRESDIRDFEFQYKLKSVENAEFKKVIKAMKFLLKNTEMIEIAFAINKEINK